MHYVIYFILRGKYTELWWRNKGHVRAESVLMHAARQQWVWRLATVIVFLTMMQTMLLLNASVMSYEVSLFIGACILLGTVGSYVLAVRRLKETRMRQKDGLDPVGKPNMRRQHPEKVLHGAILGVVDVPVTNCVLALLFSLVVCGFAAWSLWLSYMIQHSSLSVVAGLLVILSAEWARVCIHVLWMRGSLLRQFQGRDYGGAWFLAAPDTARPWLLVDHLGGIQEGGFASLMHLGVSPAMKVVHE